jgi:hypothetical protein
MLTILQEMKHIPFADKPRKATYMWRDIKRRAEMYGIPIPDRACHTYKRAKAGSLSPSPNVEYLRFPSVPDKRHWTGAGAVFRVSPKCHTQGKNGAWQ